MEELLKPYGVSLDEITPFLVWSENDYFNNLSDSIKVHAKLLNALHIRHILSNPSFGASSIHEGDLSVTFSESSANESVYSRLLKLLIENNTLSLGIAVSPYIGTEL